MSQKEQLSEQQEQRLQNLQQIRELGFDPYPKKFDVTHTSQEILDHPEWIREDEQAREELQTVAVAGRMMTRRVMGKASFFNLQDNAGTIQVYVRRDDIGREL